jgi:hypothetical protein
MKQLKWTMEKINGKGGKGDTAEVRIQETEEGQGTSLPTGRDQVYKLTSRLVHVPTYELTGLRTFPLTILLSDYRS